MQKLAGHVCSNSINGQNVVFFVVNPNDSIQGCHFAGEFYEKEELQIIGRWFMPGTVFVDIGADVGNHTIYVAKHLDPKQIIVFEPNPLAMSILSCNLALNALRFVVDSSLLGYGLSNEKGRAVIGVPENNLGGAKLHVDDKTGVFRVAIGDNILAGRRVDFLKIDVEGMEMKVIDGLRAIISQWRPRMFVEVDNANAVSFKEWCAANKYAICQTARRYPENENYMVIPSEQTI